MINPDELWCFLRSICRAWRHLARRADFELVSEAPRLLVPLGFLGRVRHLPLDREHDPEPLPRARHLNRIENACPERSLKSMKSPVPTVGMAFSLKKAKEKPGTVRKTEAGR